MSSNEPKAGMGSPVKARYSLRPLGRIQSLAARWGGLIPPGREASVELARKIDAEARLVAAEADRLLSRTIATEAGRTFPDRAAFRECLTFLARLSGDPAWDFLLPKDEVDE